MRKRRRRTWWSTARGRGSRSPTWLDIWGYQRAREQRVRIDLAYTSAYFERDPQPAADVLGVISTATPGLPRPAVLLAQEPDAQGRSRWVLGFGGYGADQPDGSIDGMRQRAQSIGAGELIEVAERQRDARPDAEVPLSAQPAPALRDGCRAFPPATW